MATVIPVESLRRNPSSVLFEGRDEVALSLFVTEFARGDGPALHTHPYPEVFLVDNGTAAFEVGDEHLLVGAGRVVVVPAQTPHRFTGAGDAGARVLSMHPRGRPEQTEVSDGVEALKERQAKAYSNSKVRAATCVTTAPFRRRASTS